MLDNRLIFPLALDNRLSYLIPIPHNAAGDSKMTYSLTSTTLTDTLTASAFIPSSGNAILSITGQRCASIAAHVPAHVATATAAAFNRAMEVTEADCGLVYATDAGDWNISNPMPKLWLAQHDEITGDNDPSWMTAEAHSLKALQDLIDDIVDAESCSECKRMVGEGNVTEVSKGEYLCGDCLDETSRIEADLREMADDDKAHAQREAMA